jgi:hypothetical protein
MVARGKAKISTGRNRTQSLKRPLCPIEFEFLNIKFHGISRIYDDRTSVCRQENGP